MTQTLLTRPVCHVSRDLFKLTHKAFKLLYNQHSAEQNLKTREKKSALFNHEQTVHRKVTHLCLLSTFSIFVNQTHFTIPHGFRFSIPPQSTKPSTPTAMTGSVHSISSTGSKPNPISNTQLIRTIVCSTFYVSSSNSSFLGT